MGDEVFDLFGNPVRAGKGKRGRPRYEVTERNRNKVKMLLALGWSNERVANAIDASLATLKRYFGAELKVRDKMRDRLDAERLMVVTEQAMGGNVGAHKQLDRMIERNDRMEAERQMSARPKAERLGKKQVVAQAAADADAQLEAELALEAQGHGRLN